ncbi:MAG: ATP-dependent DNA helicase RecG, partial [Calditrichaeota bacterium]
MASAQLNRLHQPVDVLVSVGPKRSAALNDIGIHTIEDLFYYFPRRYLDRSMIVAIKNLKENQAATVIGRVVQADIKKGRRNRFELILFDGTSYLTCIWFSYVNHWQKAFAIDEWLAVSGKFTRHGSMQIVHPEFDRLDDEKEGGGIHTGKIVPVYPSTESLSSFGLDSRGFRRLLAQVLAIFSKDIVENLPATILEHHSLISLQAALPAIH